MQDHRQRPRPTAPRARTGLAALAGLAIALAAPALGAQGGGPGFSFQAPRGGLTLRAGFAGASAKGDLFDFATDTLTLGRGDFAGASFGADLAWAVPGSSRLDVLVGAGIASASAPSEFRHWVDENDQPITQTTTFRRVPITAGVRAYLVPRGRGIGRFAWVPTRLAPYVGAGIGAMWYRFRQEGDFVDYQTLDVFGGEFETSGWGATGYGQAGLDFALGTGMALTADARYMYAKADVGGDFDGFDRIDLSGLTTTVGFTIRF